MWKHCGYGNFTLYGLYFINMTRPSLQEIVRVYL